MKRLLKSGCCLGCMFFCFFAKAQVAGFKATDLSISFSGTANNYNNSRQALVKFVLKNSGKKILPASGWKIYFNVKSDLKMLSTDDALKIERHKGNLFSLVPSATFKSLPSGESYSTQMLLDDGIINKSDQPEGFYLVWDDQPSVGDDIKNVIVSRVPLQPINGRLESDFAKVIYERNSLAQMTCQHGACRILPTPVSYVEQGDSLSVDGSIHINTDELFLKEAALLNNEFKTIFSTKSLRRTSTKTGAGIKPRIYLNYKKELTSEAYELTIDQQNITINAGTAIGIFYGIQSLKMLMPAKSWSKPVYSVTLPCVKITDAPRFGYRGLMIDVARDFQTKEEVKRVLELMALFKMNTFHFHITDDEGWRLEIDGLPELTSLGANRGHSLDEAANLPAAYGSGATTGKLYGSGFYSKEDFIEILKYAAERHIQVIPEIETPGHARAAIKAMDARYRRLMAEGKKAEALQYFLRDTADASVYTTAQSFHDNVINVALPSCYNFIEKVVSGIDQLYKEAGLQTKTIHFGGDEVPAGTWEKSPACNALIAADASVKNTNDLWYYYLGKVNQILHAKGISLAGWEEIGLRKTVLDGNNLMIPNPGFVNDSMQLYVWNNIGGNEDLAYKAANAGYKVILAPVTNFYLDMIQYKTYDEPGYYWGSVTDILKTYQFIPFDLTKNMTEDSEGNPFSPEAFLHKQRLTDYGKNNILGIEAALWGETIKGPQQLEYMLLPRLVAVAERGWQKDPAWATTTDTSDMRSGYIKAWSSFVQATGTTVLPMLDHYNESYNYRIPPAGAVIQNGKVYANAQFPGLTIRYTVNAAEPTLTSKIYNGPITEKGIIRLKIFNAAERESYTTIIENR